jgi:hypothetical protein
MNTTIEYIELVNFQSHYPKTRIDLADFTALVGQSSSGKTAIMRGLGWLFYGDWDERFPFNTDEVTAVAIGLTSGARIVRMRRGDENKAIVTVPGNPEPFKYKDFGYQIPGIFDLINVRPIVSGKQKVNLNFSTQDDPVFMVSDQYSKPAKAQWLGRLYGAHVVNNMLRLMAKDKKDATHKVELEDVQLSAYTKQIATFDDLDAKEALLAAAEADMAQVKKLESLSMEIYTYRNKVEQLAGRAWIMKLDTKRIHAAIEKLGQVERIKWELDKLALIDAQCAGKAALMDVDLRKLRLDIDVLARLTKVSDNAVAYAIQATKIKAKRHILSFDATGAKMDLRQLEALTILKLGIAAAEKELDDATKRNAKTTSRLEKANEAVKKAMIKNDKCILCGGTTSISAEFVARNMKALIEG